MKIDRSILAPLIGVGVAATSVGSTFTFAALTQRKSPPANSASAQPASAQVLESPLVASGLKLFLINCAHCHAEDATGDEGPDLHGLRKSDERLLMLIKNGIKGEMPRFNEKLADADLDALVAFLDSLR